MPFSTPDLTYGWSKVTGEFLAKQAHERYGLNIVVYRPFSGYAEDQHETYPFPAILNRFLRGDEVIDVYGTGEQMRDFIHMDDVLRCVWQTKDKVSDASAINISTGIGTTFIKLIEIAVKAYGGNGSYSVRTLTDKPVGVFARVGDTTKQKALGFTPTITLEEGIKRYFAHNSKV